ASRGVPALRGGTAAQRQVGDQAERGGTCDGPAGQHWLAVASLPAPVVRMRLVLRVAVLRVLLRQPLLHREGSVLRLPVERGLALAAVIALIGGLRRGLERSGRRRRSLRVAV